MFQEVPLADEKKYAETIRKSSIKWKLFLQGQKKIYMALSQMKISDYSDVAVDISEAVKNVNLKLQWRNVNAIVHYDGVRPVMEKIQLRKCQL